MRKSWVWRDLEGLTTLTEEQAALLAPREERALLVRLAECRRKLDETAPRAPEGCRFEPTGDGRTGHRSECPKFPTPSHRGKRGAVWRQYRRLRARLALANFRLVAHVAKQFRDRGVPFSDLMQEGFCGLLEAIDRFDLAHETKLATYATWWIRDAIQRAVASEAYPVRLSPRHLRQLATYEEEGASAAGIPEIIHRIHAATRPTVSLDATLDGNSDFTLLQLVAEPEHDRIGAVDTEEVLSKLLDALRPREREVVEMRFGLGGHTRRSLSQVGQALGVSKERVRQIQDRALEKLRASAIEHRLGDLFEQDRALAVAN